MIYGLTQFFNLFNIVFIGTSISIFVVSYFIYKPFDQVKYESDTDEDEFYEYKYLEHYYDLLDKKCLPCEGGAIPFDISEIHKYQKKVDGWDITEDKDKIFFLSKKFKFEDFIKSQNFINEVGKISEEEGHHPDILFGWGYAEIKITTHAIEGLSENDFILAAKIDQLINV